MYRNDAAGLAPSKEFLCKMTEKMQADAPPSCQAGFVRCCLNMISASCAENPALSPVRPALSPRDRTDPRCCCCKAICPPDRR
ncbi:MAG TPA: hypothetical protein DDX71_06095 [Ruminococcus sp.]|nr:hypothetical protein [Ruminococcus sp.]